jgi:hypothetical protein
MLSASRYVIVEVGGCGVCHLNGFKCQNRARVMSMAILRDDSKLRSINYLSGD